MKVGATPTTAGTAALLLLILTALAAPANANHEQDPSAPYDFRNAEATTFGSAQLPAYTTDAGESVALTVPLLLHPEELTTPAFRYLIGFNLHSDSVHVDDVTLTLDGKPVAFERDERGNELQPRFILHGGDLPRDAPVELLLSGVAKASADGRMHVGVLAIAFDAGWNTLRTRDGGPAQAYAFTLVMSDGHAAAGLAPRFQGEGNSVVALVPLAVLALAAGLGLRAAWRRLHPPMAKAQARPSPVPAPTLAPPAPPPRVVVPATPRPAIAVAGPPSAPANVLPAAPIPFDAGVAEWPAASRPLTRAPMPVAVMRRKAARPKPRFVAATPILATTATRVVARRTTAVPPERMQFEAVQPAQPPAPT